MVQVLRGLGDVISTVLPPKIKQKIDTMSTMVEIVFFKLNQIWDKKDPLV